jgi:glycosyltransferase involved in cell wall biosynthesis
MPRVSVLLSVRDGLPHLRGAVASILDQSEADLELVAVDDGSTDGSGEWLEAVAQVDRRVTVVRRPHAGLTRSLNTGLALCAAPLVARLDADDSADPNRLRMQADYLDAHPDVGLLGSWAYEHGPGERACRLVTAQTGDSELRAALRWRNPFIHSSVMFRGAVLALSGPYDESFRVAQDYDLWLRMARATRLACLPVPLVTRLRHGASVTARRPWARRWAQIRVRFRAGWRAA